MPCRLTLHKAWASSAEPAVPVTVVTGLNPSRLQQLETQCKSWGGPVSAAVYVVLLNQGSSKELKEANQATLAEAQAEIDTFHAR